MGEKYAYHIIVSVALELSISNVSGAYFAECAT